MKSNDKINFKQISNLTKDFYTAHFKRTLQPKNDEWTSLASIVEQNKKKIFKVICLSTGTKVVTGNKAKYENLIRDCHAESLCRRAFKVYLIQKLKETDFKIENYKYHLFISQLPCGTYNKYKGSNENNVSDKKPGNGEISSKPTCLSKILRWNKLGLQGKNLSLFSIKVRFDSVTIGNCDLEFKQEFFTKFKKCFVSFHENKNFNELETNLKIPEIFFDNDFVDSRFIKAEGKKAMFKSICCFLYSNDYAINEIVEGRKSGLTLKNLKNNELILSSNSIDKLWNEFVKQN